MLVHDSSEHRETIQRFKHGQRTEHPGQPVDRHRVRLPGRRVPVPDHRQGAVPDMRGPINKMRADLDKE
jgi:hypothetical protein